MLFLWVCSIIIYSLLYFLLVSELKEQARNIRTLENEISTLKTSRNILFTKQRELQEEIRALRGTLRSLNNSHFALIDKLKRAEDDGR